MKMYAMRDRKSGKFVGECWTADGGVADGYTVNLEVMSDLSEVYHSDMYFLSKPEYQAEYMNRTYGLDVEIVSFTRTVKYEEVAE